MKFISNELKLLQLILLNGKLIFYEILKNLQ